ncbi:MAG: septal ring lytic transglycosylase RlpA family protein [Pseudomonadota bacterium]
MQPTRRGNPPVYTVLGKKYKLLGKATGYRKEGLASWYGTKFHGRQTSLGERFDMYKLTAAHKHLPIPCYARVTNLENGRQTIVRINDRGPFHDQRIIDLSYAAAVKLGFHERGVARVRVQVVEPKPQVRTYLVQVGAFNSLSAADGLHAQLRKLTGVKGTVIKTSRDGKYRVQLGPVSSGTAYERLDALLQAGNFGNVRSIPQS